MSFLSMRGRGSESGAPPKLPLNRTSSLNSVARSSPSGSALSRGLGSLRRAGSMLSVESPPGALTPSSYTTCSSLGNLSSQEGSSRSSSTPSRPKTRRSVTGTPPTAPVPPDEPLPDCRDVLPPPEDPQFGSPNPGLQPNRECNSQDEPCGLTPASLKHLRRQNGALTEDKERLLAEVARLQALLRDTQNRVVSLEALPAEGEAREADLQQELEEAKALATTERIRADELEELSSGMERQMTAREAEIASLKQALEEELQKSCEAAHEASTAGRLCREALVAKDELEDSVRELRHQVSNWQSQCNRLEEQAATLTQDLEQARQEAADAKAVTESAAQLQAAHKQQMENLRTALLGNAIQSKLELHIAVPHVVLTYNQAPPLIVSASVGLSKARIAKFLDSTLFPHFDPIWMCLDGLDRAPDGTNKRTYSSRMLERLTESIKDFIDRSQNTESATLGEPGRVRSADSMPGGRSHHAGRATVK